MLTHEGIQRVQLTIEPVYTIDSLISKFGQEREVVLTRVADHPNGLLHLAVRTSERLWKMAILELTKGHMTLETWYNAYDREGQQWVAPVFGQTDRTFSLRCKFEFGVWAQSGLRLFLGTYGQQISLWVYYEGQIYRPPFGNIFDTCQLCIGRNEGLLEKAFSYQQTDSAHFSKVIQLLSESPWNLDTFHPKDIDALVNNVRFDSTKTELSMLPPLKPELIKNCMVAANKDLAAITAQIVVN
jgi:hypothetical protein